MGAQNYFLGIENKQFGMDAEIWRAQAGRDALVPEKVDCGLIDPVASGGMKSGIEDNLNGHVVVVGFEKGVRNEIDFGCRLAHIAVELIEQDLDGGLGGEDGIPEGGKIIIGFEEKNGRHGRERLRLRLRLREKTKRLRLRLEKEAKIEVKIEIKKKMKKRLRLRLRKSRKK